MKFTVDHFNGIALENPVAQFCKHKLKLADKVDHNNFDPDKYPNDNHLIVDVEVKDKALIECTNPKQSTFMNDEIIGNKFDYFHRADPQHKLLWIFIISFLDSMSSKMKALAKRLNIHIIDLGFHAEQFGQVIKRLFKSSLYHLLSFKPKVKPTIKSAQPNFIQSTLPVVNNSQSISKYNLHISKYNLHQHGEYSINWSIEEKEEWIMAERRRECDRIRRLLSG